MKLLEVAALNPPLQNTRDARWELGYNAEARACGVQIDLEEACDTATVPLVGTVTSAAGHYKVVPFAIRGFLRRSVMCSRDDDVSWFKAAFTGAMEYAISRALVIQPAAGAQTWIGDTGAQNAASVTAARALWFSTVVSTTGNPIMHVPPSLAPGLVTAGVLMITTDGVHSIFGDPVVIAPGYEKASAQVFFTGDIGVHLSGVDDEGGLLYRPQLNTDVIPFNQIAAIDVAPCSIVRVGA